MNAVTATSAPSHFETFSDAQKYLAKHAGGEAIDYARDKAETLVAARRVGVEEQVAAAIRLSRELGPTIDASVARASRDLAKRDAEVLMFDRGEPGVPRGRAPDFKPTSAKIQSVRAIPRVWLDDARLPDNTTRGPVKGLIGPGELGVIYGPSGGGKTFFTGDLVGHVAIEMPWRGRRTSGGLVVYIAAEAGLSILRRFVAWRDRHLNETRETRVPLAIVTRGVNLMFPVEVEGLIEELRAVVAEAGVPLALVVFDTLSRSIPGGDENGPDMSRVVAASDRIRDEMGAATLVVHHTGKDGTKGARGHSSLIAAADTMILVADRVATVEKVRDGIPGEKFAFALEVVNLGVDADGDPITTCLVIPTDASGASAPSREPKLSGVAKVALQALREAIGEHGEMLPATSAIPQKVRGVELRRWQSQFELRYGEDGERKSETTRKAFQRAREALFSASMIEVAGTYVWIIR